MADINDGGPAFPVAGGVSANGEVASYPDPGMSLRDWFAGQAPIGANEAMAVWGGSLKWSDDLDRGTFFAVWTYLRYEWADAMLTARAEGGAP